MKRFFGVNSKIVLRNTLFLTSAELIIKVISLLWIIFLARLLSVSEYGKYAYINAFIALFSVLPDSGAGLIAVREIAQNKKNQRRILPSLFFINLTLSCGAFIVIIFYGLIKESFDTGLIIFFAALSMVLTALRSVPVVYYESHERMNFVGGLNILNSLLIILPSFVFFILFHSLLSIFIGMAVGGGISLLFSWRLLHRFYRISLTYDYSHIKKLFFIGLPLGIASIASMIFSRIDSVMLSHMLGFEAVGKYNSAVPIVFGMIQLLHVPFAMSIYPTLSRINSEDTQRFRKSFMKALLATVVWTGVIATTISLLSPHIVPLIFGSAYKASSYILSVLIFILPFASLSALLYKVLIIKKQQNIYLAISIAGAVVNIVLNIILISSHGVIGAAYASVITQAVLFLIYIFSVVRYI